MYKYVSQQNNTQAVCMSEAEHKQTVSWLIHHMQWCCHIRVIFKEKHQVHGEFFVYILNAVKVHTQDFPNWLKDVRAFFISF